MEPNFKNHSSKRCHSMTGIALILIGAIILAGNIGWIPAPIWDVLYSWPSIFLIITFIDLLKQKMIVPHSTILKDRHYITFFII